MNEMHPFCKRALWALLCFLLSLLCGADAVAPARGDWRSQAPRVFLDCHDCDQDFIRGEIGYVNYVRDRGDADVHILSPARRTAAAERRSPSASWARGDTRPSTTP